MKPDLYALYQKLSPLPGGKRIFSRSICLFAPYFGTIKPTVMHLEPGLSRWSMPKRRAVHNHIGTVHAIAVCNLCELCAGTMIDATLPTTHRWIPKGMDVQYLSKANTDLIGTATLDIPTWPTDEGMNTPVQVTVLDTNGKTVVTAQINMWVTPKH